MDKINFTKEDLQFFTANGYSAECVKQIKSLRYEFHNYNNEKIPFEIAVEKYGKFTVLGAIGRAAFHFTAGLGEYGVQSNLYDFISK